MQSVFMPTSDLTQSLVDIYLYENIVITTMPLVSMCIYFAFLKFYTVTY